MNVGGARAKTAVSWISSTLTYRKFFNAIVLTTCWEIKMYLHDSIRSEAVRFDGLNPPPKSPYVKNPKFTKHSGFHKFNSPVLSDVEKFTEFNGTIF